MTLLLVSSGALAQAGGCPCPRGRAEMTCRECEKSAATCKDAGANCLLGPLHTSLAAQGRRHLTLALPDASEARFLRRGQAGAKSVQSCCFRVKHCEDFDLASRLLREFRASVDPARVRKAGLGGAWSVVETRPFLDPSAARLAPSRVKEVRVGTLVLEKLRAPRGAEAASKVGEVVDAPAGKCCSSGPGGPPCAKQQPSWATCRSLGAPPPRRGEVGGQAL